MVFNLKRLVVLFGVGILILKVQPIYGQRGETNSLTPTVTSSSRTNPTPREPAVNTYVTVLGFRAQDHLIANDPLKDLRCADATINENIVATNAGKAGPGCSLSVDVRATGEWVFTGGFFDSPPYVWGEWPDIYNIYGNNLFVIVNGGGSIFQCSLPTYTLDQSALPTYVKLDKQEDIPSNNPIVAPGKRYLFTFTGDAPLNQSFTLPISFSSTCDMFGATTYEERYTKGRLVPIAFGFYGQCTQAPTITINPRQKTLRQTITLSESCAPPTNTPVPPTLTPLPTATAIPPTSTPVPTLTPQPPAQCNCDGLDVTSGKFEKGQEATFVVYVKVDPNNPAGNDAEGKSVILRLEKKLGESWVEVTNSGVLPFVGPTLAAGTNIRRYAATWSVGIPAEGQGVVAYRVIAKDADIRCAYRSTTTTPSPTPRTSAQQTSGSLLTRVLQLFGIGIDTSQETTQKHSLSEGAGITGTVTVVAPRDSSSLQLGTFNPITPSPAVVKSCKQIEFEIAY